MAQRRRNCPIAASNGRSYDCSVTSETRPSAAYGLSQSFPTGSVMIPPLAGNFNAITLGPASKDAFFIFDMNGIPPGSYIKEAYLSLVSATDNPASTMMVGLIDPLNPLSNALYSPPIDAPNILTPSLADPPPTKIDRGGRGKFRCLIRDVTLATIGTTGVAAGGAGTRYPLRRAYVEPKTGKTVPFLSNTAQLVVGSPTIDPTTATNILIRVAKTGAPGGNCVVDVWSSDANGTAISFLSTASAAWSGATSSPVDATFTMSPSFSVSTGAFYLVVISSTAAYSATDFGEVMLQNSIVADDTEDFLSAGRQDGFSIGNYAASADRPYARLTDNVTSYINPYRNTIITAPVAATLTNERLLSDITPIIRDFVRSSFYRAMKDKVVGLWARVTDQTIQVSETNNLNYFLVVEYVPPQVLIT